MTSLPPNESRSQVGHVDGSVFDVYSLYQMGCIALTLGMSCGKHTVRRDTLRLGVVVRPKQTRLGSGYTSACKLVFGATPIRVSASFRIVHIRYASEQKSKEGLERTMSLSFDVRVLSPLDRWERRDRGLLAATADYAFGHVDNETPKSSGRRGCLVAEFFGGRWLRRAATVFSAAV